jgi:hypothetical protein
MNNYAREDENVDPNAISDGDIGRQVKRVKVAVDLASAPTGITDDDVGARATRLSSLMAENLLNNADVLYL